LILQKQNGVSFFQFPHLTVYPHVWHGVFTRKDGLSSGPFRSLNVSFGIGDQNINVESNRDRVSQCFEGKDTVYLNQIHGTNIVVFKRNDTTKIDQTQSPLYAGDATITDIPGKFLIIQIADCQSVLMYDPIRRVIANVHSGWRGSIKNIIGLTVQTMKKNFHCNPSNIVAGIGPSLGPCCAEFINYTKEIPEYLWKYKDEKDHFDFWSLSCDQLCEAGVLFENIFLGKLCTKCNTDLFFSYRGEGTTGRFASVIGLQSVYSEAQPN
jgi:YfiH family protein